MTIGATFGQTVNGEGATRPAATPTTYLCLATFIVSLLAAAGLGLLQPGASDMPGPVRVSTDALAQSEHGTTLLEGRRPDWRQVRPGKRVSWLSGTWQPSPQDERGEPVAFRMSGPFSGELYWNGRLIGRKGRSSADPTAEIPGPIDSAIIIPDQMIAVNNRWALRISSHHAGYKTSAAIHEMEIGPYRGSGRELNYYLPALLLFGGIAACAAVSLRRFATGGEVRAATIAASAAMLAGAMIAEVSRAIVNYSYDWHLYRQLGILLLLTGHMGFLIPALFREAPKLSLAGRGIAIVAVVGVALAFLLEAGFDKKIGWMLGLAYGTIFFLSALRRHTAPGALYAGVVAVAGLIFLTVNLSDFLNAGVYAFGLALLLAAYRTGRSVAGAAKQTTGLEDPPKLLISCAGKERLVQWSQVYMLRAFGNTTELTLRCGTSLTNNCGLGQLLLVAPPEFLRVHKSFAVNLALVIGVQTIRRGSYRLILKNGTFIPLSRTKRNQVRAALKQGIGGG